MGEIKQLEQLRDQFYEHVKNHILHKLQEEFELDYRLQTWSATQVVCFKHRNWKVWGDVAVNLHINTQPLNADVHLYIDDANDMLLQPGKDNVARLRFPIQNHWYEKNCG